MLPPSEEPFLAASPRSPVGKARPARPSKAKGVKCGICAAAGPASRVAAVSAAAAVSFFIGDLSVASGECRPHARPANAAARYRSARGGESLAPASTDDLRWVGAPAGRRWWRLVITTTGDRHRKCHPEIPFNARDGRVERPPRARVVRPQEPPQSNGQAIRLHHEHRRAAVAFLCKGRCKFLTPVPDSTVDRYAGTRNVASGPATRAPDFVDRGAYLDVGGRIQLPCDGEVGVLIVYDQRLDREGLITDRLSDPAEIRRHGPEVAEDRSFRPATAEAIGLEADQFPLVIEHFVGNWSGGISLGDRAAVKRVSLLAAMCGRGESRVTIDSHVETERANVDSAPPVPFDLEPAHNRALRLRQKHGFRGPRTQLDRERIPRHSCAEDVGPQSTDLLRLGHREPQAIVDLVN